MSLTRPTVLVLCSVTAFLWLGLLAQDPARVSASARLASHSSRARNSKQLSGGTKEC